MTSDDVTSLSDFCVPPAAPDVVPNMANWFGGNIGESLGAIRNRVNESLAEVLAEEEPEAPAVQLAVLREKLEQQKAEIGRLEARNGELASVPHSFPELIRLQILTAESFHRPRTRPRPRSRRRCSASSSGNCSRKRRGN